jgi:pimeloyl-ACP methyl ester carboxylesterase
MRKSKISAAVTVCLAWAVASGPTAAAQAAEMEHVTGPVSEVGVLDGARFHIEIPADWNGGLVMWMHGYLPPGSDYPPFPGEEGYSPELTRGRVIPLPEAAVALGYAVARSAYSRQGFSLSEGVVETNALREYFQRRYGPTSPTIIAGAHNGGLMTYDAIERYGEHYDGALAIGGIGGPKLEWLGRRAFDMRLLFDYFYPETPGSVVDFSEGPSWSELASRLREIIANDPERARPLLDAFRLETTDDLVRCVTLYTSILGDLYTNRAGGNAFGNTNTVYVGLGDDAKVNREIPRYESDPAAVAYLKEWNSPTCRIDKPVLGVNALHDPLVPVDGQREYAEKCEREGTSDLFVQMWMDQRSPAPSDAGLRFALEALTEWITNGTRPEPGDLYLNMERANAHGGGPR